VQVQVQEIERHVAGAHQAHDRVEVRAVHVKERALHVHDLGDLPDLRLEETQRVRQRHHDDGGLFVHGLRELREVHLAALVRGDLHGLESRERGAGGVRAVRESGTTTRRAPPRSRKAARAMSRHVSSPWSPAEGCSEMACIPVIAAS
jgi:hypothetical protein